MSLAKNIFGFLSFPCGTRSFGGELEVSLEDSVAVFGLLRLQLVVVRELGVTVSLGRHKIIPDTIDFQHSLIESEGYNKMIIKSNC